MIYHIKDFIGITKKYGCISAYAYLGDVIDTSEGDKKTNYRPLPGGEIKPFRLG